MKDGNVYFLRSCTKKDQFPKFTHPEFAFMGRSNVGKSSLLNTLLGKKDLVKTGSKPGVTKTINFFVVNDNKSFVDLPGFGYAKLPSETRKKFMPMIMDYAKARKNLKLVFLLIDIRRTPGDFEHEIIEFLASLKIPTAITLTKSDKLSKNERRKSIQKMEETLGIGRDYIFITSSKNKEGKKELLSLIEEFSQ